MGKKNRRGKEKPKKVRIQFVDRPFAGLSCEADLVAMREILPAASLCVKTTEDYGATDITLATILPGMAAALRRPDDEVFVAVQSVSSSGDASLDLAARILQAIELEPGDSIAQPPRPVPGPRLQDILDSDEMGELQVHESYEFWLDEAQAANARLREAVDAAGEAMVPMRSVPGVPHAYWCRMQREFIRLVVPEDEDTVLNALARLQHARQLSFPGGRFVGAFRAQGLQIPVFELDRGAEADDIAPAMQEFMPHLEEALASTEALTPEERRARSGIISRQVTLR